MAQSQNVFITGSSSGFGFLISKTLLERGYTVFATMRNIDGKNADAAEELRAFAEKTEGTVHTLELDVADDGSVQKSILKALDLTGNIDVVVNNAGIGSGGFAETFSMAQFEQIFDINVFGVQRVNRAVLPSMRERGAGLLLHISSVMGRFVLPFAAPYTATKFALEGLAESYRYELSGTGVDVAIVEPGGFPTDFGANMKPAEDKDRVESYGELKELPDQFWGGLMEQLQSGDAPDPQTVADTVLELIETPPGKRPLRTVVDPMSGGEAPKAINQTSEKVQTEFLKSAGMEHLLTLKTSE